MPLKLNAFRIEAHDRVTPEHLNVAAQLLGMPLAAPGRRLLSIAVDLLLVALLSNFGNLWLFAGLALPIALALYSRRGASAWAPRREVVWAVAAGLIAIGLQQAWVAPAHHRPHLHLSQRAADTDAADLAEAVGAIASAPGMSAEQRAAARIAVLEAALAQARQPKPFHLRDQLALWADEVGIGLGWAIAYFSLLPAWLNGQTVGKKLFGLRVVELTGKPLTVMRAFKRYGGYAAGMATGLFGFLQIFWDGNRQAIQDKTAHTVVIDLRRASRDRPAAGEPDRTLPVP